MTGYNRRQSEVLLVNSKQDLTELAKFYGIRGYSKHNKGELGDLISQYMVDNLEKMLIGMEDNEWEQFKALCSNPILVDYDGILGYRHLLELGIAYVEEEENENYISLASDLKERYEVLNIGHIEEARKKQGIWRRYRQAGINLYGAVEISWIIELFNRDYPNYMSFEAIWEAIGIDKMVGYDFQIIKDYFVHESLYLIDTDDFDNLLEARTEEEYYEPTKAQIKNYSDYNYYERNIHVEQLASYLKKHFNADEALIEDAIVEVILETEMELQINGQMVGEIIEQLNNMGFETETLEEMQALTAYIIPVINNTRTWVNKGYTANELSKNTKSEGVGVVANTKINAPVNMPINIPLSAPTNQENKTVRKKLTVGRNEPCPCGSGIKYKKCCGK